jgi:hypothetical protein
MTLGLVERQGGLFNVSVRCEVDLPATSVHRLLHRERDRQLPDDEQGGQDEGSPGSALGVSRCLQVTTPFGDKSRMWWHSSGVPRPRTIGRLAEVRAIVVWLVLQDVR